MIRFFGGRPRFLLNMLSSEKVVSGEFDVVKKSLLLLLVLLKPDEFGVTLGGTECEEGEEIREDGCPRLENSCIL